jgi:hypothetical protein
MTSQKAEGVRVGDRVQLGGRTGIVEFVVSDVFMVKWDGGRDSDAYTREAFEKRFITYDPKEEIITTARPARRGPFVIPQLPAVRQR